MTFRIIYILVKSIIGAKKSEGTSNRTLVGCPDYLISTRKGNLLFLAKDYMNDF